MNTSIFPLRNSNVVFSFLIYSRSTNIENRVLIRPILYSSQPIRLQIFFRANDNTLKDWCVILFKVCVKEERMVGGRGGLIEGEAYNKKEYSGVLLDGMKRGASSRKNGFVLILLLSTLNRFHIFWQFLFYWFSKNFTQGFSVFSVDFQKIFRQGFSNFMGDSGQISFINYLEKLILNKFKFCKFRSFFLRSDIELKDALSVASLSIHCYIFCRKMSFVLR